MLFFYLCRTLWTTIFHFVKIFYFYNPDLADQQIGRGDAPESETSKPGDSSSDRPYFDDDGDDEVPVNYAQVNYGEGKACMPKC